MQSFAEYLNNLFKFYLGIVRVYSSTIKPRMKKFGLNVLFKKEMDSFIFFKGERVYYFSIHDDKLVLEKEALEDTSQLSVKFIADIYFTNSVTQGTSVAAIKRIMRQKPNLYYSDATHLFSTFRRVLARNVNYIQKRNEVYVEYKKIGQSKIEISDFAEDKAKELAPRLTAFFNQIPIVIERLGKTIFAVHKNYDKIPQTGQLRALKFDWQEQLKQNKYANSRDLLSYNPNPNSAISRLAALLSKQIEDTPLEKPFEISSEFPFNEDQLVLLESTLIDPLIFVKGIAGTGKTTVAAHGIIELTKASKRVLVIAQPHRVVDNLLMTIVEEAPELENDIIRLASQHSLKNVSIHAKQYHETQVHERIRSEILRRLNEAIEHEANSAIRELQEEVRALLWFQEPKIFDILINLSQKIVFSTVDGLMGSYSKVSPNRISIGRFHEHVPEFDLVVFEDSSDMNFVDFVIGSQYGHRWALLSDPKQIRPIVESTAHLPMYRSRTPPSETDEIEKIESLEEIEVEALSKQRLIGRGDKLLRIPTADVFLELDFLYHKPLCFELEINYRFSRSLGEAIEKVFSLTLSLRLEIV